MEITHVSQLVSIAPIPRKIEFEGEEYRIGSSSCHSLADMFTGESPLGHIAYGSEAGNEITVWFALFKGGSVQPFFAAKGDKPATSKEAVQAYETMRGWNLV